MCCCPVVEVGLKTKHKILIAPTKASVKCVTAYIRLWLVILWLWCVMLLFWLLLRSLVGYCCACGLLMWLCCCAIGDIHSGVKSGCKLVTLLSFLWYDKLWGPSQRVVTLFSFQKRETFLPKPKPPCVPFSERMDKCHHSMYFPQKINVVQNIPVHWLLTLWQQLNAWTNLLKLQHNQTRKICLVSKRVGGRSKY